MHAVTLVGGGLAGSLLALMLARRGLAVTLYERRADLRGATAEEGRSINLALSARGIHALDRVGLADAVLAQAIPMRGRGIHPLQGDYKVIPYGRTADEVIHSVGRRGLNAILLDALAMEPTATVQFQKRCTGYDIANKTLKFGDELVHAPVVIATDGALSAVRLAMMQTLRMDYSQEWLAHGYKELTVPPAADDGWRLDRHALHIWPRGGFMMIALPNPDGSFTATLFLAHDGEPGFDTLTTPDAVKVLFDDTFPDAVPLLPDLRGEFFRNPTGGLWTVRCRPWRVGGQALLLGDAAHAIVPFFGQGMNCAFEDCETLCDLFDHHGGEWEAVFAAFEKSRKPNADAIAEMALDNFVEMRDTSADPRFALRRQLEHKLEERFPGRFRSKYAMVSFLRVPYAEAMARGRRQDAVLMEACRAATTLDDIDADAVFERLQAPR